MPYTLKPIEMIQKNYFKIMFGFEKIPIYARTKEYHSSIRKLAKKSKLDYYIRDQLYRASFSVVLNISEGSGRFTKADQRRFLIMSRSSLFETVSILDFAKDEALISADQYQFYYDKGEEISKTLYAMIRKLE